jgi:hypothetical protein
LIVVARDEIGGGYDPARLIGLFGRHSPEKRREKLRPID